MTDAQPAATLSNTAPPVIHRLDYRPPDWLVPAIALDFILDPARTEVRAVLEVRRNGDHRRPLRLDGDGLAPLSVKVDGREVAASMEDDQLVIELAGDVHRIETHVAI